jgi:hypothetical protein
VESANHGIGEVAENRAALSRALELESEQRADLLRDSCGGDEDLRQEVEALLAMEQRSGLLDHGLWDRGPVTPLRPGTEHG